MKDSGLSWLGEIPEHWEVMPIKRVLYAITDTEHKTAPAVNEGKYLVARTTNIKEGRLVFDGAYYTDENGFLEWTRRGIPVAGDILFTREAPAGEACIVPKETELCIGQRVVLLRVNHRRILADFLLNSLYSGAANIFIRVMSQGSTVPHINMGDIPMIPVFLPSLDEQCEITDFICSQSQKMDGLISAYSRQLTLLAEYRAALIHECVTGRRAVPDDFNPGDYTND